MTLYRVHSTCQCTLITMTFAVFIFEYEPKICEILQNILPRKVDLCGNTPTGIHVGILVLS